MVIIDAYDRRGSHPSLRALALRESGRYQKGNHACCADGGACGDVLFQECCLYMVIIDAVGEARACGWAMRKASRLTPTPTLIRSR